MKITQWILYLGKKGKHDIKYGKHDKVGREQVIVVPEDIEQNAS